MHSMLSQNDDVRKATQDAVVPEFYKTANQDGLFPPYVQTKELYPMFNNNFYSVFVFIKTFYNIIFFLSVLTYFRSWRNWKPFILFLGLFFTRQYMLHPLLGYPNGLGSVCEKRGRKQISAGTDRLSTQGMLLQIV